MNDSLETSFFSELKVAQHFLKLKDWSSAEDKYQNLRINYPNEIHGYTEGAVAVRNQGKFLQADEIIGEGIEKIGNRLELFITYSDTAMDESKWSEAKKRWLHTLDIFPANEYALLRINTLLSGRLNDDEVVEVYKKIGNDLRLNQIDADAKNRLSRNIRNIFEQDTIVFIVSTLSSNSLLAYSFLKSKKIKLKSLLLTDNAEIFDEIKKTIPEIVFWNCSSNKIDSLLKSKLVICDFLYPFKQRNGIFESCTTSTSRIQLWHGIPAKKIGYTSLQNIGLVDDSFTNLLSDILSYDFVVSESSNLSCTYQDAFPASKIISLGSPRTDFLLSKVNTKTDRSAIKTILYAPTFRAHDQSSHNFLRNIKTLIENILLLKEYKIIIKLHQITFDELPLLKLDPLFHMHINRVQIAPLYSDISDYYPIADVLITDYSSSKYEFLLFDKPIFIYQPDIDDYTGLFTLIEYSSEKQFPIGPAYQSANELIMDLDFQIKEDPFKDNRLELKKYFYGSNLDGRCTERFIKYLKKLLGEKVDA